MALEATTIVLDRYAFEDSFLESERRIRFARSGSAEPGVGVIREVLLTAEGYTELGEPEKITVRVEPGDTLNKVEA